MVMTYLTNQFDQIFFGLNFSVQRKNRETIDHADLPDIFSDHIYFIATMLRVLSSYNVSV